MQYYYRLKMKTNAKKFLSDSIILQYKENLNREIPVHDINQHKHFSAALKNFLRIKLSTAIAWRNSREFLPSSPLLTGFQSDSFFHSSSFHTQHVLIFIISKVSHCLCLLVPRIPHHLKVKRRNSINSHVRKKKTENFWIGRNSAYQIPLIVRSFSENPSKLLI